MDGYSGDSGNILVTWDLLPANDYFTDATEAVGLSGTARGFNLKATKEAGEPDHAGNPGGKSVWWRGRAPSAAAW